MERELKRARLAGKNLSRRRFNPVEEVPDLIAVVQQVHRGKSISVQHKIDEGVKPFGDREDMLELLGNLLDNAYVDMPTPLNEADHPRSRPFARIVQ